MGKTEDGTDEVLRVARNMIAHGGGFVVALGKALRASDLLNAQRIKDAFPEYWKKYLEWGGK